MSVVATIAMALHVKCLEAVWVFDYVEGNNLNEYEDGSNPLSDILDRMPPYSSTKDPILIQLDDHDPRFRIFRLQNDAFLLELGTGIHDGVPRIITAVKGPETDFDQWYVHLRDGTILNASELSTESTQLTEEVIAVIQLVQPRLLELDLGESATFDFRFPGSEHHWLLEVTRKLQGIEVREWNGSAPFPVVRWTEGRHPEMPTSRPLTTLQATTSDNEEQKVWYKFDEMTNTFMELDAEMESEWVAFIESSKTGTKAPCGDLCWICKFHPEFAVVVYVEFDETGGVVTNEVVMQRITGDKRRLFLEGQFGANQTDDGASQLGLRVADPETSVAGEACFVCLEAWNNTQGAGDGDVTQLPCGHLIHAACLKKVASLSPRSERNLPKCPLCRQEILEWKNWKILDNRIRFDDLSLNVIELS